MCGVCGCVVSLTFPNKVFDVSLIDELFRSKSFDKASFKVVSIKFSGVAASVSIANDNLEGWAVQFMLRDVACDVMTESTRVDDVINTSADFVSFKEFFVIFLGSALDITSLELLFMGKSFDTVQREVVLIRFSDVKGSVTITGSRRGLCVFQFCSADTDTVRNISPVSFAVDKSDAEVKELDANVVSGVDSILS
ncbi:Hypothetical predicted protein [Octopus vulgaris]|uniref:Uncharacterized protein n=1 Tax=Octopus vulgaris TaxID=6645 RepID=A0AA36BMI3_OCTVU|nr:Hypothetical predicted protein [Octopus vulgaris]